MRRQNELIEYARLMDKTFVCRKSDIPADGMRECVLPDGAKVLVFNAGDEYFACQAECPHQHVPLCDGFYDGALLTCWQHLWQWDIRTGEPLGPAEQPLRCHTVGVEGDGVYLLGASASS